MNKYSPISMLLAGVLLTGCAKPPAAAATAAAEHTDTTVLALDDRQIAAAQIGLATAGPGVIRESLSLYGVIAPNAEQVREVAARFPGTLRSVARQIGDPVSRGTLLATVESNESLQTYALVSPLAGVVTARNTNPGEQSGDKPLFTIADLSTVWVELALFPRDLARVRLGQTARIRSADAGQVADGRLVYLAPFGSVANQTLTARLQVDNPDRIWVPGLYVTADLTIARTELPLTIRAEALQTLDGASTVFVRTASGFEPRRLRLGRSDGERVEVLQGLVAGERYATVNSFILKADLGKHEAGQEH
jgi:cobalt-zinc-cadmium efflux system membrane fusion protein